jgi:hypothetical protein
MNICLTTSFMMLHSVKSLILLIDIILLDMLHLKTVLFALHVMAAVHIGLMYLSYCTYTLCSGLYNYLSYKHLFSNEI